mmetsp:Transcript_27288/g.63525  ORF Transcript_27288/g.63525 Transcript_27288/m.63525 type:complete len:269 (+) Transcript_27288:210-1016(+)
MKASFQIIARSNAGSGKEFRRSFIAILAALVVFSDSLNRQLAARRKADPKHCGSARLLLHCPDDLLGVVRITEEVPAWTPQSPSMTPALNDHHAEPAAHGPPQEGRARDVLRRACQSRLNDDHRSIVGQKTARTSRFGFRDGWKVVDNHLVLHAAWILCTLGLCLVLKANDRQRSVLIDKRKSFGRQHVVQNPRKELQISSERPKRRVRSPLGGWHLAMNALQVFARAKVGLHSAESSQSTIQTKRHSNQPINHCRGHHFSRTARKQA